MWRERPDHRAEPPILLPMTAHMTVRRYLQLDVFAERPGTGNPLGAILDSAGLDAAAMQALAAWLNLSETVFFVPADDADADYHIRIFTPSSELPFAGHPSVGAAWAARDSAGTAPRIQQCAAGLLPVQQDATSTRIRSPRGRQLAADAAIANRLRAEFSTQALRDPELWDNGPAWWLVEFADPAQVRTLRPDFAAIAAIADASHATGVAVFAIAQEADHQLVVRAFCPGDAVGVPEDPVTGSANALIGAYLASQDRLPGSDGRYVASQGRELGRDGRVHVHVDADGEVWIGGQVQCVIRGQIDW